MFCCLSHRIRPFTAPLQCALVALRNAVARGKRCGVSVAALVLLVATVGAEAGGFDNTGRPFGIIFDGEAQRHEVRFALSAVTPDIAFSVRAREAATDVTVPVDEVVPAYINREWAMRWAVNDVVSCAMRAEEPFRADIRYPDDALSYRTTAGLSAAAPIDSRYESESLTLACRYDMVWSAQRLTVFAGPKHQKMGGYFSADLSEANAGVADNLEVDLNGGSEWGYVAGLAYAVPKLALRVSLTYHNEIQYALNGQSLTPVAGLPARRLAEARATTLTPQSWQLAMQSGIATDWLLYSEIKWSEWSRVDGIQVTDGVANPQLELYRNDTLDLEVGLIHRLTPSWRLGLGLSSSLKLGSNDLPSGVDSANLRDPQGRRHALTLGAKVWLSKNLATDVVASANYLESKFIAERFFTADIPPRWVPAIKWGISWHP